MAFILAAGVLSMIIPEQRVGLISVARLERVSYRASALMGSSHSRIISRGICILLQLVGPCDASNGLAQGWPDGVWCSIGLDSNSWVGRNENVPWFKRSTNFKLLVKGRLVETCSNYNNNESMHELYERRKISKSPLKPLGLFWTQRPDVLVSCLLCFVSKHTRLSFHIRPLCLNQCYASETSYLDLFN